MAKYYYNRYINKCWSCGEELDITKFCYRQINVSKSGLERLLLSLAGQDTSRFDILLRCNNCFKPHKLYIKRNIPYVIQLTTSFITRVNRLYYVITNMTSNWSIKGRIKWWLYRHLGWKTLLQL